MSKQDDKAQIWIVVAQLLSVIGLAVGAAIACVWMILKGGK
jgi:hypothetical protein